MRDAIVYSGWTWETYNVPERISLALAQLGCKVLYCEVPVSPLRRQIRPKRELENGLCGFQPAFLSSRISRLPLVRNLQAKMICRQIEKASTECGLHDPIFLYSFMDDSTALCREMRKRHFTVHICMDHSNCVCPEYDLTVEASDMTLAIPRSAFHRLRARFGDKVKAIPQSVDFTRLARAVGGNGGEPQPLAGIPRPRLGFFGHIQNLNLPVLQSLLETHPAWQFVSAGTMNAVPLGNSHPLPWTDLAGLGRYLSNIDVGFMLYDCYDEQRLHCVPLKLFEYFAFGIPVVSTPLVHLWEYQDLVYLGDTAVELAAGVQAALNEPADSPKRTARIEIARRHSLEHLATVLGQCLPLEFTEIS